MCTTSLHSKLCELVLWYGYTRIMWMDSLLQIILHSLPPRVCEVLQLASMLRKFPPLSLLRSCIVMEKWKWALKMSEGAVNGEGEQEESCRSGVSASTRGFGCEEIVGSWNVISKIMKSNATLDQPRHAFDVNRRLQRQKLWLIDVNYSTSHIPSSK